MSGLFLTLSLTSSGQQGLPEVNAPEKAGPVYYPADLAPGQAEFIGFRNVQSDDLSWQPSLGKISENESEDDELLRKIKAAKNRLKAQQTDATVTANKTTIVAPTLDTNFVGVTTSSSSTPLDNTLAVSNGGIIISCVNSRVSYYTTAGGAATYTKDLYNFVSDFTLTNNMCDPKVIYDPVSDRFIFYTQICDLVPRNSYIVVGCSKTNNPSAGWYFYKVTGNPLADNSIFDYPKMGISNDEIFITGNLFRISGSSSTFNTSIIYQIAKAPCYSGGTISIKRYTGVSNAFTFMPCSYAIQGSYGPGIFLVSAAGNTSGSTDYRLFRISNNIASGSASLAGYYATCSPYSTAGDAFQQGTSHLLNTGDCRVQDGYYLHGYVTFVHNVDVGSGYCGLMLARIRTSDATTVLQSAYGAVGTIDRAYGALAHMTNDSLDQSAFVAFNETAKTFYPRASAASVSHTGTWSSTTIVKAGTASVNYGFGGASDRWGDYTGMCKKYNANPYTAWMAGMYGTTGNKWNQWIAKLKGTPSTDVQEIETEKTNNASVFPNPVYEDFSVKFDISTRRQITVNITDMQGKVVADLFSGIADAGENIFSFNKANLSPGMYSLNIYGDSKLIKNEKIVIAK